MEEIFNKIILGYKTNNENLMEANIKNWMSKDLPNPFAQDTVAHELYNNALMAYKRWTKKVINYRRSKVEMVEYIQQLIESGIENPYAIKIEIEKKSEPEKEVVHVLGVLPEKVPEKQPKKEHEQNDIIEQKPDQKSKKKGILPIGKKK